MRRIANHDSDVDSDGDRQRLGMARDTFHNIGPNEEDDVITVATFCHSHAGHSE
jgi:hypothetical protein